MHIEAGYFWIELKNPSEKKLLVMVDRAAQLRDERRGSLGRTATVSSEYDEVLYIVLSGSGSGSGSKSKSKSKVKRKN